MTRGDALFLVWWYSQQFREAGWSDEYSGLHDRFPRDGSEAKAMRWLGFAQGAAVQGGLFTLDEVKQHSRQVVEHGRWILYHAMGRSMEDE